MPHCDFAVGRAARPVLSSSELMLLSALWSVRHFRRDGPAMVGYDVPMNDCCGCERDTTALAAPRRGTLLVSLGKVTITEVPPALS